MQAVVSSLTQSCGPVWVRTRTRIGRFNLCKLFKVDIEDVAFQSAIRLADFWSKWLH